MYLRGVLAVVQVHLLYSCVILEHGSVGRTSKCGAGKVHLLYSYVILQHVSVGCTSECCAGKVHEGMMAAATFLAESSIFAREIQFL